MVVMWAFGPYPKAAAKMAIRVSGFLAFIGIVKILKHNKTNSMGDF
jgi:hypothetical protein